MTKSSTFPTSWWYLPSVCCPTLPTFSSVLGSPNRCWGGGEKEQLAGHFWKGWNFLWSVLVIWPSVLMLFNFTDCSGDSWEITGLKSVSCLPHWICTIHADWVKTDYQHKHSEFSWILPQVLTVCHILWDTCHKSAEFSLNTIHQQFKDPASPGEGSVSMPFKYENLLPLHSLQTLLPIRSSLGTLAFQKAINIPTWEQHLYINLLFLYTFQMLEMPHLSVWTEVSN